MTRITYNDTLKPSQKEKPQTTIKLKKQNPYIYRPNQITIDKKPMEDFVNTCRETKNFIDSSLLLTLVPYKAISHFVGYFFFDKYARRCDFTRDKIKLRYKSRNQIDNLCRLRELREANKFWHKLSEKEQSILNMMSMKCYSEKLSYESVRKVVKKEIWKSALDEIKHLKHKEEAIKAKQLLFSFLIIKQEIQQKLFYTIK
jgi:hypothetical protein